MKIRPHVLILNLYNLRDYISHRRESKVFVEWIEVNCYDVTVCFAHVSRCVWLPWGNQGSSDRKTKIWGVGFVGRPAEREFLGRGNNMCKCLRKYGEGQECQILTLRGEEGAEMGRAWIQRGSDVSTAVISILFREALHQLQLQPTPKMTHHIFSIFN